MKKILNFSSVNNSISFYRIFISFLFLTGPITAMSQDNSFFEKTKIQHKINEARHNFIQGNVKSALLNYKEAIALNPSNVKAEYGLAECYYKLQNYKKAKFHAEKAYLADPKIDDDILFLMGRTYFRLNEITKAKQKLSQFKEMTKSKSKLKDYGN